MSSLFLEKIKVRTYKSEQSNKEITSHAGMALIGSAIENFTSMTKTIDRALPKRHGTPTSDVIKAYIGLVSQGKNDFEAINGVRNDDFFHQAMGISKKLPTEACVRTRMNKEAETLIPLINDENIEFIVNRKVTITPLYTGHIPLDIDVTPHDNSKTKKEGVSLTYKKMDGYAPIASYFGQEGWCVGYELRNGSQHSQCGFIDTLSNNFNAVKKIMKIQPNHSQSVLVRLDSGHDAKESRFWLHNFDAQFLTDFIIKWNPRKEASEKNKSKWFEYAKKLGCQAQWSNPREGKKTATFSLFIDEYDNGIMRTTRRVMQVTERIINKQGQSLLFPTYEVEGWWTTLENSDQEILALYRDHATSEQFHSEIKTDLDLERLPSGKFSSNELILTIAISVYNILKWIGLAGLMEKDSPIRHKSKRRRIRTVIQELIYIGSHVYERSRRLIIRFGKSATAFHSFNRVYQQLAYG